MTKQESYNLMEQRRAQLKSAHADIAVNGPSAERKKVLKTAKEAFSSALELHRMNQSRG